MILKVLYLQTFKKIIKNHPLGPNQGCSDPLPKTGARFNFKFRIRPWFDRRFRKSYRTFLYETSVCHKFHTFSPPIICTHVGGPLSYIINVFYNSSTYFDCLFSLHSAGAG